MPPVSGVGTRMLIEMWADVVCPWCYLGKRRLESALAGFDQADNVDVRWRSFQLDPAAPTSSPDDPAGTAGHLADKYGVDLTQAHAMNGRVTALAAEEGLPMRLDRARPANTLDAHRLIQEAARRGVQGAMAERLMRAYFAEGERVDEPGTLLRLSADAGLDEAAARAVLESELHADQVRADQAEAAALGATGVPFVVLDRRLGVSGAQPVEVFRTALSRAWAGRVQA